MNRTRLAIGILLLAIALAACSQTAETSISPSPRHDITPPELIDVSLDLSEVDVSGEDREITVTARVTDDLSGVDLAEFHFVGPTMRQEATATLESVLFGLITDGEFVGNLTLPRYSEAGTWRLERVSVVDHVGNRREYDPDALAFLGPSTSIEVTATVEDIRAPELVDLSIDRSEVDVSAEDARVDVAVLATDDLSGVKSVHFYWVTPWNNDEKDNLLEWSPWISNGEGEFLLKMGWLDFEPSGTWRIARIEIYDNVGNLREYNSGELTELELSTSFEITGGPKDVMPPELISLAVEPPSVDTNKGVGEITIAVRATDDVSGTGSATLAFISPTSGQAMTVRARDTRNIRLLDAEFKGRLTLPRYSETGIWHLAKFELYDGARNVRTYQPGELIQLGLPTSFEVTASGVDPAVMEGDVEAPEVVGVTLSRFHGFFPMSAEMARRMNIDIDVTDDLSGVKSVYVDLIHPITGREERILARGPVYGSITEGSYHAGLIARKPIGGIPQLEGNVVRVEVADYAGNIRTYGLAELRPLTGWAID